MCRWSVVSAVCLFGWLAACAGTDATAPADESDVTNAADVGDVASVDGGRADIDSGGDGGDGAAGFLVSPARVSFGGCGVDVVTKQQFAIRALGAPLTVTRVAFDEDASSRSFRVSPVEPVGDGAPISLENPLRIPADQSRLFVISYRPQETAAEDPATGERTREAGSVVLEGEWGETLTTLDVSGYGIAEACTPTGGLAIVCDKGAVVEAPYNLHLHLEGTFASGAAVSEQLWRVAQPEGSESVFLPSASAPSPSFEVNSVGVYRFSAEVWDASGAGHCLVVSEVFATPGEGLRVELLWHTPGDPDVTDQGAYAGADLDLHLLHPAAPAEADAADLDGDGSPDPYFDPLYDCYWDNVAPDWGVEGQDDDDPVLMRDDRDGVGPEVLMAPLSGSPASYEVAVHYWRDHDFGPSTATVRVYGDGVLIWEEGEVALVEGDLWSVCHVDWPSGEVTPVTGAGGSGRRITRNYEPTRYEE